MPSQDKHDGNATKRTRGRTGCLNCRRRRKKCDEKKPSCSKCNLRAEKCEWDTGITFRCSGLSASHPSMRRSVTAKTHSCNEFQIIQTPFDTSNYSGSFKSDVTPRDSAASQQQPYGLDPNERIAQESHHVHPNPSLEDMSSSDALLTSDYRMIDSFDHASPEVSINGVLYSENDSHHRNSLPTLVNRSTLGTSSSSGVIDPALESLSDAGEAALFHTDTDPFAKLAVSDLEALDYLMSTPTNLDYFSTGVQDEHTIWASGQNAEAVPRESVVVESPDMYSTYYPDPTYKELHSVLHNHMVSTARATTALTRQATPELNPKDSSDGGKHIPPTTFVERAEFETSAPVIRAVDRVTSRRELKLWQNYLEEVAVWLDMFDIERHFQLKIPMLAKTADHLHFSILALSARQMERMHAERPYTESLTLYQKAIELIVRDLHTLDTSVIAACVLLCVLEMMSSSPRAWGRHLDGCAMLLQAAGINGTVGGVRQAMFWCFARMDVWGGYLSDQRTKIPENRWFMPGASMSSAVSRFKAGAMGFDSYANYAVFLCASVINVLSNRNSTRPTEVCSDLNPSYSARWKALFDLLEDWYNSRPEEMQPLMACPTEAEDHQHPFPIILYGTSPAINGNQLYHASSLLMLQEKPKDVRLAKSPKSIQWHARQICGIATSNCIHGPWINALQPLWIAGKVMSHPIEHRVLLETLARIEKETGWATAWRAEDLKEYWGETDD